MSHSILCTPDPLPRTWPRAEQEQTSVNTYDKEWGELSHAGAVVWRGLGQQLEARQSFRYELQS